MDKARPTCVHTYPRLLIYQAHICPTAYDQTIKVAFQMFDDCSALPSAPHFPHAGKIPSSKSLTKTW